MDAFLAGVPAKLGVHGSRCLRGPLSARTQVVGFFSFILGLVFMASLRFLVGVVGGQEFSQSFEGCTADFTQVVWCSIFLVTAALAFGGRGRRNRRFGRLR